MYTSFTDWESGLYLAHHGVRGQKWGVRNYQNSDGTLTAAGRAHYGVGQGGSRRMARQYNRQMKKLNKLKARADIATQRENIKKYDKRAKVAAGVGLGAAAVAGGMAVRNMQEKARTISKIAGLNQKWDERLHLGESSVKGLWKVDRQAYDSKGAWTGKGYSQSTNDSVRRVLDKTNSDLEGIDSNIRDTRSAFNKAAGVRKAITYGAAGVAAVSAGVAVYNKIQSHMAKTRMSEAGHSKAVARVKAQTAKMEQMFANTPYSQLMNNQNKPKNNQNKSKNNRNKKRP